VANVVKEAPMRSGPSTNSATTSIGSGGTTLIHSTSWSGFAAAARRLPRLPSAQPKPPAIVRRNGSSAADSQRCCPTSDSPPTATTMPTTCAPVSRSRRKAAPSTTVNGAEDCSTNDARPTGMPAARPQYRNRNCRMPNPTP